MPKFSLWKGDHVSTLIWNFSTISQSLKILSSSRSATHEATCITSLLYWISSFILLVTNRTCIKILQKFQNIMTRIVRGFQSVSYLCFILKYFYISRRRSQLLCKKNVSKMFANFTPQKNLCWSPILTICRPKTSNCIKIESPAQMFFPNFCEIS